MSVLSADRLERLTRDRGASNVLDMTPLNEELAEKLRTAADYVETQKRGYDTARQAREDTVREAALTGASYREIATAAGMSYQRVAQLLTGEKPVGIPYDAVVLARCPKCKAAPRKPCDSRTSRFHTERHERISLLRDGSVKPGKGEPGPLTPLYCRMILVHGVFPNSRGDITTNPKDIVLAKGEFLGRWTGHKWERADAVA